MQKFKLVKTRSTALISGVPEGLTVNNLRFQPEALLYHETKTPEGFTQAEVQTVSKPYWVLVLHTCLFSSG